MSAIAFSGSTSGGSYPRRSSHAAGNEQTADAAGMGTAVLFAMPALRHGYASDETSRRCPPAPLAAAATVTSHRTRRIMTDIAKLTGQLPFRPAQNSVWFQWLMKAMPSLSRQRRI